MKRKTILIFSILLHFTGLICAQQYNDEIVPDLEAMSIPSAPAFSLLGVNPEMVTRPSDVKNFKVDWRIKNYKVAPDLALEAQPLWHLYFKNQGPQALLNANAFTKILSTTSVSLATAKIDNVNHLSWAIKMNVYKEKDPLTTYENLKAQQNVLKENCKGLEIELDSLVLLSSMPLTKEDRKRIRREINDLEYEIKIKKVEAMQKLKEASNNEILKNWNMDMVDVGFGRVYTYDNSAVDSLNFRTAGLGIWINAAKGIGKNGLLTSLFRWNHVGINSDVYLGMAYRYGSERYNFFTELVYARKNNVAQNGFLEEEQFEGLRSEDLGVGWYGFEEGEAITKWTIAYGGDFRLSKNILLNFALRTNLSSNFSFQSFLPIANIVCLMK